jgi:hypothetical protein
MEVRAPKLESRGHPERYLANDHDKWGEGTAAEFRFKV